MGESRIGVWLLLFVEVSTGCADRIVCSCCPVRDGGIVIVVSLGQS